MYQGDGIYYFNDHEKTYIRKLEELFQIARSIIDSMPSQELPVAFRLAFRLLDRTGKIICLSRIRSTSNDSLLGQKRRHSSCTLKTARPLHQSYKFGPPESNGIPFKKITNCRDFYSHSVKAEEKAALGQEEHMSDAAVINLSLHAQPPASDCANDVSDGSSLNSFRDMTAPDPLPPTTASLFWPPKPTYSQRFGTFLPLPKTSVGATAAANEDFEVEETEGSVLNDTAPTSEFIQSLPKYPQSSSAPATATTVASSCRSNCYFSPNAVGRRERRKHGLFANNTCLPGRVPAHQLAKLEPELVFLKRTDHQTSAGAIAGIPNMLSGVPPISAATATNAAASLGKSWKVTHSDRLNALIDECERIIDGRKVFKCKFCGKMYDIKSSMRYHMKIIHLQLHLRTSEMQCRICGKQFTCISAVNRHQLKCSANSSAAAAGFPTSHHPLGGRDTNYHSHQQQQHHYQQQQQQQGKQLPSPAAFPGDPSFANFGSSAAIAAAAAAAVTSPGMRWVLGGRPSLSSSGTTPMPFSFPPVTAENFHLTCGGGGGGGPATASQSSPIGGDFAGGAAFSGCDLSPTTGANSVDALRGGSSSGSGSGDQAGFSRSPTLPHSVQNLVEAGGMPPPPLSMHEVLLAATLGRTTTNGVMAASEGKSALRCGGGGGPDGGPTNCFTNPAAAAAAAAAAMAQDLFTSSTAALQCKRLRKSEQPPGLYDAGLMKMTDVFYDRFLSAPADASAIDLSLNASMTC